MKIRSKKLVITACFGALATIAITAGLSAHLFRHANAPVLFAKQPSVILDAGHGGMDSGAVAASGVCEKDLNLQITNKTRSIMKLFGIESVMTRDSDISIGFKEGASVRENKQNDLYGRAKIAKEYSNCDFISIHMNKFEQSQYYGAQVFYGKNERAAELAEGMQTCLREALDRENDRKIKKSPEGVYIMQKIEAPAVIAECGFLSNTHEAQLLQQEAYQIKTACAIAASYANFLFE